MPKKPAKFVDLLFALCKLAPNIRIESIRLGQIFILKMASLAILLFGLAPLYGATAKSIDAGHMTVVESLPSNCLSMQATNSSQVVQDWRNLVEVEHCDRIRRLQRISSQLPPNERPVFYDGSVLANRLPSDIGITIPVLRVVFPERVFFDTDSITLKTDALEVADIIAASLRSEPPDVVMFVAGHADARASREYNAGLSIDRANALAEEIFDRGIDVASVWRVGFGEDLPLLAGDGEYAYGQNRRIEFLFASRSEALAVWLADQQIDQLCQGRTQAEIEECQNSLDFEPSYEVIQVQPRALRAVRPSRSTTRVSNVRSSTGQNIDLSETERASVSPQRPPRRRVEIAPPPRQSVEIVPPRSYDLDLARRTSARTY